MLGKARMESPIKSCVLPGCCCGVSDREGVYVGIYCMSALVCVSVCVWREKGHRNATETLSKQLCLSLLRSNCSCCHVRAYRATSSAPNTQVYAHMNM